ncbi:uncharacterized protein BO66DRAFT_385358 [Aspergillus aculeatinus CBS 121060]|uniref:Uncharacterized protein n=1 Tax=Aspergillus aculeatinus CBS 121060 TaxID=1448322 RepID=A0ACD1GSP0_9EURO|nr:hypothetical protein BO66DRAFT_385358 [Aspergillus aculeatinus CBS 121060]RAH64467.1 hypothetical protein BO66DRAFT_385358 [Aspergillus aculeatinus CBS 121060]
MLKISQDIQVFHELSDVVDQVTRIPLELGQHRLTIAIAAVCILTGGGLVPVIIYLVLTKAAGLQLWIVFTILAAVVGTVSASMMLRRTWRLLRSDSTCRPYTTAGNDHDTMSLDYFQWNFFTGFCYIAALMIAAVRTSLSQDDNSNNNNTSTRLMSLSLSLLVLQVSSQLLCAAVMVRIEAKYPFRVSSMERTAMVRPGVYTIIEDVVAVDGGQGQQYRRLLDARYRSSKPIRLLLAHLDLAWGVSGMAVAAALIALTTTLPSAKMVFIVGWLVPWGWTTVLVGTTRWM